MKLQDNPYLPTDLPGLVRQLTMLWRSLVDWSRGVISNNDTTGLANGNVMAYDSASDTFKPSTVSGGGGTVTAVTGTAPVVSSGGTSPAISMAAATASVPGYLLAVDWGTFNGKQAALGFTPYNATNPAGYTANLGTVTSASVITANGISGTIATATTTPAITLVLGAITPSSVVATGTVTGTNLSGTNTGNQTIALTGDVTGTGTGSFAATISSSAVTLAKMANMASGSLIYRKTALAGVPEVQTLATLRTDLVIADGTYTPTITNVANLTSTTANVCQYLRVGNTVTVSGSLSATATAINISTALRISLPIASSITANNQLAGVLSPGTSLANSGAVFANIANTRAQGTYVANSTAADALYFHFTYQVL